MTRRVGITEETVWGPGRSYRQPPHTALQRTRLRAPLSFETFGDSREI